jgi:hypothetical protein
MDDQTTNERARARTVGLRWLSVCAFLLGMAMGTLLGTGLADEWTLGSPPAGAVPTEDSSPAAAPESGAGPSATADLEACLRVVSLAEESSGVIEEFGTTALDEVLHRLHRLRLRLEAQAAACRMAVGTDANSGGTPEASSGARSGAPLGK